MKGKKLLFIAGFPSGGTDLTKTVLNAHPAINICGEVPFLVLLSKKKGGGNIDCSSIEKLANLREILRRLDIYNALHNLSYDFRREIAQGETIGLESALHKFFSEGNEVYHGSKTPQFTEQMDLLYSMFPTALFIIVVRDVRDICLSWSRKWGKDKILCAAKWTERLKNAWDFAATVENKRILFIRYEDLLENTKETLRKACDFLELEFSASMLEHHKHTKEKTEGKIKYGEKIDKKNKDKWKTQLSFPVVRRIEEIAGDVLGIFGYLLANEQLRTSKIKWYEKFIGRFRDLYAMLFIGNRKLSKRANLRMRLKNITIEIKKRF